MADEQFAGREVVPNDEATTGDVTICPYSGKKFEVKADSPRVDWNGKSWVLCCQDCVAHVQADPEKYLGKPTQAPAPTEPPVSTGD